jgi:hypothetical protein
LAHSPAAAQRTFEITNFGNILHTALSLAVAGALSSVTLAASSPVTRKQARKRLSDYTARGYLTRIQSGGGEADQLTIYAITRAGRERLAQLNAPRLTNPAPTPTGATGNPDFGPLIEAMY